MARLESKLNSAWTTQHRFRWIKSYVLPVLPEDRFMMLASLIGLVVLAVAIKGFFEFWKMFRGPSSQ